MKMKFIIFFVGQLFSSMVLPKGAPIDESTNSEYERVAPIDKELLFKDIKIVINQSINGSKNISDPDCRDLKINESKDIIRISVGADTFLILKNATIIDSKNYTRSSCYKSITSSVTQIECVARSIESINRMSEQDKFGFYIKFDSSSLLMCPTSERPAL